MVTWRAIGRICVVALATALLPVTSAPVAAADEGATISGTVSGPIGSPDGPVGPLAGFEVVLREAASSAYGAETVTAADGTYSISAAAGLYSVYFRAPGFPDAPYVMGCYLAGTTGLYPANDPACTRLDTSFGSYSGIDAVVPMFVTVSGRLLAGGSPAAGVPVRLFGTAPDGGLPWSYDGTTGADGRYSVRAGPGTYTLYFDDLSGAYFTGWFVLGAPGNFATWGLGSPVEVGQLDVAIPDVAMPIALHVDGTVSGPGGPLAEIAVGATSVASGLGSYTATAPDGSFSVAVTEGDWQLSFGDPQQTYASGCYLAGAPGNFTADYAACGTIAVAGDTTLAVTLPLGGHTQPGTNVYVQPSQSGTGYAVAASVTFGEVTEPGTTYLARFDALPAGVPGPAFSLGTSPTPTYFEISTDARFSTDVAAPVTICLQYNSWEYANPSAVRLFHFEDGEWKDVTTTRDDWQVCGQTSTLSPFVIGELARQPQSISFEPLADVLVGAGPIALTATASSGLSVAYSAEGSCKVEGATLSIENVGACTVTASQAGDASWEPAEPVSRTLAIAYRFDGFLQPVNDTAHARTCGQPCPLSVFKAGSTIPLKLQLKDANGSVVEAASPPWLLGAVDAGTTSAAIDETETAPMATTGAVFVWDPIAREYAYNWSTKGLLSGHRYELTILLPDRTRHSVYVALR